MDDPDPNEFYAFNEFCSVRKLDHEYLVQVNLNNIVQEMLVLDPNGGGSTWWGGIWGELSDPVSGEVYTDLYKRLGGNLANLGYTNDYDPATDLLKSSRFSLRFDVRVTPYHIDSETNLTKLAPTLKEATHLVQESEFNMYYMQKFNTTLDGVEKEVQKSRNKNYNFNSLEIFNTTQKYIGHVFERFNGFSEIYINNQSVDDYGLITYGYGSVSNKPWSLPQDVPGSKMYENFFAGMPWTMNLRDGPYELALTPCEPNTGIKCFDRQATLQKVIVHELAHCWVLVNFEKDNLFVSPVYNATRELGDVGDLTIGPWLTKQGEALATFIEYNNLLTPPRLKNISIQQQRSRTINTNNYHVNAGDFELFNNRSSILTGSTFFGTDYGKYSIFTVLENCLNMGQKDNNKLTKSGILNLIMKYNEDLYISSIYEKYGVRLAVSQNLIQRYNREAENLYLLNKDIPISYLLRDILYPGSQLKKLFIDEINHNLNNTEMTYEQVVSHNMFNFITGFTTFDRKAQLKCSIPEELLCPVPHYSNLGNQVNFKYYVDKNLNDTVLKNYYPEFDGTNFRGQYLDFSDNLPFEPYYIGDSFSPLGLFFNIGRGSSVIAKDTDIDLTTGLIENVNISLGNNSHKTYQITNFYQNPQFISKNITFTNHSDLNANVMVGLIGFNVISDLDFETFEQKRESKEIDWDDVEINFIHKPLEKVSDTFFLDIENIKDVKGKELTEKALYLLFISNYTSDLNATLDLSVTLQTNLNEFNISYVSKDLSLDSQDNEVEILKSIKYTEWPYNNLSDEQVETIKVKESRIKYFENPLKLMTSEELETHLKSVYERQLTEYNNLDELLPNSQDETASSTNPQYAEKTYPNTEKLAIFKNLMIEKVSDEMYITTSQGLNQSTTGFIIEPLKNVPTGNKLLSYKVSFDIIYSAEVNWDTIKIEGFASRESVVNAYQLDGFQQGSVIYYGYLESFGNSSDGFTNTPQFKTIETKSISSSVNYLVVFYYKDGSWHSNLDTVGFKNMKIELYYLPE